jgi:alkylhydroperoxidase family enzyme
MHTKDLRHGGESEERLYLLDAWRESPQYSEQERAALALTECSGGYASENPLHQRDFTPC